MIQFVPFRSEEDVREVVYKFESCQYEKDEFPHFRHLAVAAWYLSHYSPQESLARMRENLLRFTRHHGVTAYHETITQFWLRLVEVRLRSICLDDSLVDRINALVHQLHRKEILFDYYSRECVMSEEARGGWISPDLRELEDPVASKATTPPGE